MAASTGLLEVRILIFRLLELSYFKPDLDQVCGRLHGLIWASTRENLSRGFGNNKGADQPAHSHSLISAFVIRLLKSIISRLATSEISIH